MERNTAIHEKITTVTYVEDPAHQQLRMKKERLASEVSALGQKINFHENRMALGSKNYDAVVNSIVDMKGQVVGEKRSLRKSERSKQQAVVMSDSHPQNSFYTGGPVQTSGMVTSQMQGASQYMAGMSGRQLVQGGVSNVNVSGSRVAGNSMGSYSQSGYGTSSVQYR